MGRCKIFNDQLSRFASVCPGGLTEKPGFIYDHVIFGNIWISDLLIPGHSLEEGNTYVDCNL